jgi:serine/threonine protein kinase
MTPTREDIELYVMGAYDGDATALERALDEDPALRAMIADEARFETLLRDAAASAMFCPGCDDLVAGFDASAASSEPRSGEANRSRCDACGAAVRPGGYVVERVLVSNAHGRMYIAHDADGKRVVLKELAFIQSPSLDVIAAFEREAKFLRALEHAAIPRFCASFEEGTGVHVRYYLAQELVDGEALEARLEDHWFTEVEIIDIARQVLAVLVYLQTLSPMVIHRDIKPANLLRRADGSIAVVDFGAAHVQGATAGSTSIGTFGYMPIEQLAGEVDATTDPYALGTSLLHLLSRREPWRILQGANLEGINVSAPLRGFLGKLVAPEPKHRFANAVAAVAALEQAAKGEHVIPRPKRTWWRPVALAAAGLVFALSGAGAYALVSGPRAAPARTGSPPDAATASYPDAVTAVVIDSSVAKAPRGPVESLPPGRAVDLQFKGAPLHEVLRQIGQQCGVNVVVPDFIGGAIDVTLTKVPCDQALEVLLESRGLWYEYHAAGNLLRIATRKQLDSDLEAQAARAAAGTVDDPLPTGPTIDVDFKNVPLQDLLQMMAKTGGVSVVIPDTIGGMVTIRGSKLPWDSAMKTVLATHGLWYRYRPNGKVLRIAPRKELDSEDEAARERAKQR